MDELEELKKLEHLSLVSKVCTELENHLNMNNKDLAEFIIDMADKNPGFDAFKRSLVEQGADVFTDALMANLYRVITHMKKTSELTAQADEEEEIKDEYKPKNRADIELKKALYPFLAMPNNPQARDMLKDELEEDLKKDVKVKEDAQDSDILDLMAQLESLEEKSKAMNTKEEAERKPRNRSRSTSRHRHRRSRSREKRSRSREKRSRSREKRSRSKERRRSRDRYRRRSRDRSLSNERRRKRRRSGSREDDRHNSRDDRHDSRGDRYRDDRHREDRYRDDRNRDDRNRDDRNRDDRNRDRRERKGEPEVGQIYEGRVKTVMGFGCFVSLKDFNVDGLVHVSQLSKNGFVSSVRDVVSEKDEVKVKVLSISKNPFKISLSMKDVDQKTGEDLNPNCGAPSGNRQMSRTMDNDQDTFRNPDRPSGLMDLIKRDNETEDNETRRRVVKRLSSPEKFELTQLAKVNVLAKTELPYYDEETGLLPKIDEEDNEDVEVELREDDAPFLKGYGRSRAGDLSPVRIMKNPDGSLAQAALMQGALSKERREQAQQQREAELNKLYSKDTDWNDPMPDLESNDTNKLVGPSTLDMPEWKRHVVGGVKASLGRKTDLSILEQRRGLPIFKLREELIQAVKNNQILICIGETGKWEIFFDHLKAFKIENYCKLLC